MIENETAPAPPSASGLGRAARAVAALALLVFVVGVGVAAFEASPAKASPQGLAIQVAQATPAAAVGAYNGTGDGVIACDSDGEVITASTLNGAGTVAWSCYVSGTTAVFFGASGAAAVSGGTAQTLVTTSTGLSVCEGGTCANGTAPAIWRSPMARQGIFACRTSAGSVNVRCNGVSP